MDIREIKKQLIAIRKHNCSEFEKISNYISIVYKGVCVSCRSCEQVFESPLELYRHIVLDHENIINNINENSKNLFSIIDTLPSIRDQGKDIQSYYNLKEFWRDDNKQKKFFLYCYKLLTSMSMEYAKYKKNYGTNPYVAINSICDEKNLDFPHEQVKELNQKFDYITKNSENTTIYEVNNIIMSITDIIPKMKKIWRSNQENYKIKLCKHFTTNGVCERGDSCRYAHGVEELRKIPVPCKFYALGNCTNQHCSYSHIDA
jgi:hypothetical protein